MSGNDRTLEALLLAILADPQDDSCRLIYADALDEAGQSGYAEFIRVQCALARLAVDPDACGCDAPRESVCDYCLGLGRRVHRLRQRERELWGSDQAVWPKVCPDMPVGFGWTILPEAFGHTPHTPYAVVRRGFVAEVRCDLGTWTAVGPAVVRRQPVERVVVTDYGHYCYYHDPAPHQGAWVQGAGSRLPFSAPGRFDTPEDFAEAIGKEALQWAKRQAFPCPACEGKGKVWKDIGLKSGPEYGPEKSYVAPPPQRLLFDCPACEGRGWRVGR